MAGARNSQCFDNSTDDFGIQTSIFPARYWQEAHKLPLSPDSEFEAIRGRYCLDDYCARLADLDDVSLTDPFFSHRSAGVSMRRPRPCPPGVHCRAGTASPVVPAHLDSAVVPGSGENGSAAQPCLPAAYCPEGSATPRGVDQC